MTGYDVYPRHISSLLYDPRSAMCEPTKVVPAEDIGQDTVIGSLVKFSEVMSSSMVYVQKTLDRMLQFMSNQEKEIARLRTMIDEIHAREKSAESKCADANVTLEDALRGVDKMRESDEQDALYKKMEARRLALGNPTVSVPVKTQREVDADNARRTLLERARQYAASKSG
jgi:hypothetical protein